MTIAVAESCTGGLLASRLTDVPGSSAYVDRGVVCYSNRAKIELLGIAETLIAEHGAVSEPVARAMAEAIRAQARADVGVGVTGIAGPGGGTPEKPVGTVAIAVAGDGDARVRTFQFVGGREQVKFQAAQAALNMVRLMLAASYVVSRLQADLNVRASSTTVRLKPDATVRKACASSSPSSWTTPREHAIASMQTRLKAALGDERSALKWIRPEHMHLTLAFLGELDDGLARSVVEAIGQPVQADRFAIVFGGLGMFPPAGAPRVLWLGLTAGAREVDRRAAGGRGARHAPGHRAGTAPVSSASDAGALADVAAVGSTARGRG